jgi:hypothetical protein
MLMDTLSASREQEGFQKFEFAHATRDTLLAPLTAASGLQYQHNMLTVHYEDRHIVHTAVVLTAKNTLVTIHAEEPNEANEKAVKDELLVMLESVEDKSEHVTVTADNYRLLFQVDEADNYQYIGRGYIRAPADMGGQQEYLDVFLPVGDSLKYLDDGYTVESTAHGVSVYCTIAEGDYADEVVDDAYLAMIRYGLDIYRDGVEDAVYDTRADSAYKRVLYYADDRTKVRVSVLYAEVQQPGYYRLSCITCLLDQTDDIYPELVDELAEAYGLPSLGTNP